MKKEVALGIICTLFLTCLAQGEIRLYDAGGTQVGTTYATIQDAADAAFLLSADRGRIEVDTAGSPYSGTGNVDVRMWVPLTVMAVDANGLPAIPGEVVIDCQNSARGFLFLAEQNLTDANRVTSVLPDGITFDDGQNAADVNEAFIVQGLMIMNGSASMDVPANNNAGCGGGIIIDAGAPIISDCVFLACDSPSALGGGILVSRTEGQGGGGTTSANPLIRNCVFYFNTAWYGGGAIATRLQVKPNIINCLMVGNYGGAGGSAVYADDSTPNFELCTLADNNYGWESITCDASNPTFKNCIIWDYTVSGDIRATNCDIWDLTINGTGNIYTDPMFSQGQFSAVWDAWLTMGAGFYYYNAGDYYLPPSSPAVDAGAGTIVNPYNRDYGISIRRFTSPMQTQDRGNVDLGFHYPPYAGPTIYVTLQVSVPGTPPHGRVTVNGLYDPNGTYTLPLGTTVRLVAEPDPNYRVSYWTGTDDDSIFDLDTITRTAELFQQITYVQCAFEPDLPRTLNYPGQYDDLQYAVLVARKGDTIIIHPGVYSLPGWGAELYPIGSYYGAPCVTINQKAITIRSVAPDDPATVANTIIQPAWGFITIFAVNNCEPNTVISGLTIRNANLQGSDGLDGTTASPPGGSGGSEYGAGMTIDGSATVQNCIFRNCTVTGGDGGNGTNRQTVGYDGGNGGWAGGGAVFIGPLYYSGNIYPTAPRRPVFKNVQFIDCYALAGNGGNGGRGSGTGATLGRGGSYKIWSTRPEIPDERIRWQGAGGAVYIADGTATFDGCTFENCYAESGWSGTGSQPFAMNGPGNTDVASAGGAVYIGGNQQIAAAAAAAVFNDCTFSNNRTDLVINSNPAVMPTTFDSAYLGYGGAIAADSAGSMTFSGCTFIQNQSHLGGAIYWAGNAQSSGTIEMDSCTFTSNRSLQGGAVYGIWGTLNMLNCRLELNTASTANTGGGEPNSVTGGGTVFTQGGAMYLGSVSSLIGDSIFMTNGVTHSGGGLCISGHNQSLKPAPRVYNNLFVSNSAGRNGGAVTCTDGSEPNVVNCTIAYNVATGTGSGGGLSIIAGSRAKVENSLIWGNTASVGAQASLVDPNGGSAYQNSAVNIRYSYLQGGQTQVATATGSYLTYEDNNVQSSVGPQFVYNYNDPAQTDNFINNYALATTSPCIDAGSVDLDSPEPGRQPVLPLGRYAYTDRTDGLRDMGMVDVGFHRRKAGVYPQGDIDFSGFVDSVDYAAFTEYYLNDMCAYPDWCEGSDLDHSGIVNLTDDALLTSLYGAGDVTAPTPNPSEWQLSPSANSGTSITMTATTAVDNSGNAVQYYFECVSSGGHNRDWSADSSYTDTGLTAGMEYGYRVKTRDVIPTDPGRHNETAWSPTLYAFTGEDGRAPSPNPSQWTTPPYALSATSIAMTARTAIDASGVEYYFRCESGTNGYDSGWQASPSFINTGLLPSTLYTYSVKTRDKSTAATAGALSSTASATTFAQPDMIPPSPLQASWAVAPYAVNTTTVSMMANTEFDASGVEYYFECIFGGHDNDSGWQQNPAYTLAGLAPGTSYTFRVLARDRSVAQNACTPSLQMTVTTPAADGGIIPGQRVPPTPNPMTWAATSLITVTGGAALPNGNPTEVLGTETTSGVLGYWHCMTATAAIDYTGSALGIEYYFECTGNHSLSSGWIPVPYYLIQVGTPGWPHTYVWRCKARDIWGNETGWSQALQAGTPMF
jgi:hypothetical protein